MDKPPPNPGSNLQTPWAVVGMSGLLTCLLITGVAYLLLKTGPTAPRSADQTLFTQCVVMGVQGGTIVATEVLFYACVRRHSEHRLIDALVAGIVASILSYFLHSHLLGTGDLSDMLIGMNRWQRAQNAARRDFESFVSCTCALICGFQAGCHVYLWHGTDPDVKP